MLVPDIPLEDAGHADRLRNFRSAAYCCLDEEDLSDILDTKPTALQFSLSLHSLSLSLFLSLSESSLSLPLQALPTSLAVPLYLRARRPSRAARSPAPGECWTLDAPGRS